MKTTELDRSTYRKRAEFHPGPTALEPDEMLALLDDLDTALARVKVLEEAVELYQMPMHVNTIQEHAKVALARSRELGEEK